MLSAVRPFGSTGVLVARSTVRSMAYWNIEWKPAPYPCTKAQREAAAKRYGVLLSDYKPFENDGLAPGDYPDLRPFCESNRDPWEHYDYYPVKRNYNEPVPFYYEFYSEAGADPDMQHTLFFGEPLWRILLKSLILPAVIAFVLWGGSCYPIFPPEKAKQFPFCGDKEHYTFEPDE
ncbi:NADH dehydrogenase ubiquinone 1 beta [Fasciola hepatica]|uniref:NADH dehydrogenase ubiquinone 1 beta n=1 Tax=Fasciola hepatica TaxID=6192 RepID=A0A4E0RAV7_FASHE|nr:NADH dehydrogenase ubiquinone 1 beta [Fasciola hepatica]